MQDYSFGRVDPHQFKRKPRKNRLYLWIPIALLIIVGITQVRKNVNSKLASNTPTVSLPEPTKTLPSVKSTKSEKELLQEFEHITSSIQGNYSIYVLNLKTEKGFGVNEQTVLTAASINKIPILASLYNLASNGKIDLEKVIILQENEIQDYGTGSIRYTKPGTPYSLKTLAKLMMEQSDNTAAYILASEVIGLSTIQTMINSWGLTQTSIEDNKTSAKDMGNLLTKMYHGEIANKALTAEMFGFMDKSDFDDRIPAGLPENIVSYHKTGDDIGKIHDVGIIDLPDNPYYLGVLTSDITDEPSAKSIIASISHLTYEYMKSL